VKSFESLVVLQRPRQELWIAMRDHLPDFADQIADIRQVRQIDRTERPDGNVHVVNQWHAAQQIPSSFRAIVGGDDVGWIDRAVWDAATWTCSWSIEPSFFGDSITCSGQTVFAEAMAGRGTRVTFAGQLDIKPELLASLNNMFPMASGFIESSVTTMIPRNLRAVAEAAAAFGQPTSTL
jgi:hypothetical protein